VQFKKQIITSILLLNIFILFYLLFQVNIILNCKDPKDRDLMIHDFQKSFAKEKVKKKKKEKEASGAAAATAAPEIDYLVGDFRTLLDRLIAPNKEIDRAKKSQIYYRLMEPDVDADYKNAAIKLVSMTDKEARTALLAEFDVMKERQREAEEKKLAQAEAARVLAEEKRKAELRREAKAARERKEEMMKKRELMLKMRAEQRRRDVEGLSRVRNHLRVEPCFSRRCNRLQ
jgi:hypothetical protein